MARNIVGTDQRAFLAHSGVMPCLPDGPAAAPVQLLLPLLAALLPRRQRPGRRALRVAAGVYVYSPVFIHKESRLRVCLPLSARLNKCQARKAPCMYVPYAHAGEPRTGAPPPPPPTPPAGQRGPGEQHLCQQPGHFRRRGESEATAATCASDWPATMAAAASRNWQSHLPVL